MYVGLPNGSVTAGASADCAGRAATLTLSVRLYHSSPSGGPAWHLDRVATRSWKNPAGNRYVELREPCSLGKNRAVFAWRLRDRAGRLIGRHVITTAAVADSGPTCAYQLSGPGH